MTISVLSMISLILGILGMCLSCIVIGIIPCIISLILGGIALLNEDAKKFPSILGMICSAVGIAMFAVVISQSDEYKRANVATPTEIVQNYTNSGNENKPEQSTQKVQNVQPVQNMVESTPKLEKQENKSEPKREEKQQKTQHVINADFDSFSINYVSHEVSTDYEGNPCLIIYFDFTNNSENPQNASLTIYSQEFQNGVECDYAYVFDNDYISNSSKDVQKGTTIRVATACSITDMSDVQVTVKEAFSFSNKSDSMVINLNK